jgi:hypothetical protein
MKGEISVTKKSLPLSAFTLPANTCSLRGHVEIRLGANTFYCQLCKQDKPRGGWVDQCSNLVNHRVWIGG